MKLTVAELRSVIKEVIEEIGGPRGGLRRAKVGDNSSSGRKVKLGRIEDENQELSSAEADLAFPGSVDAWTEVVPELYPDFPFADDPRSVRRQSVFFKIGNKLRVAAKQMPGIELAEWRGEGEDGDWFEID